MNVNYTELFMVLGTCLLILSLWAVFVIKVMNVNYTELFMVLGTCLLILSLWAVFVIKVILPRQVKGEKA